MPQRLLPRCLRTLGVVLLVVVPVLFAPPAGAATATSYVALGDSYSSGLGADSYYLVAGTCYRSSRAYPVLWANAHQPASFTFAACAGATTDDVRSDQLGVLGGSTSLVSITIGGNDVGFTDVVTNCTVGSASTCESAVSAAENTARTTLPAKLAATYSAIKQAAPEARLVVLGYPRLFETSTSCTGVLSLMTKSNRTRVNRGADTLESVIRAQAEAAGATYVSLQSFFEGHRVCSGSQWLNPPMAFVPNSYHPNTSGQASAYLPALTSITG